MKLVCLDSYLIDKRGTWDHKMDSGSRDSFLLKQEGLHVLPSYCCIDLNSIYTKEKVRKLKFSASVTEVRTCNNYEINNISYMFSCFAGSFTRDLWSITRRKVY